MEIVVGITDMPASYRPTVITEIETNLVKYSGVIFKIFATLDEERIAILWEDGVLVKCVLPTNIDINVGEATVIINTSIHNIKSVKMGMEKT